MWPPSSIDRAAPGWVRVLAIVVGLLLYRMAVWAAVAAIATTLVRTLGFERLAAGWEGRPGRALAAGLLAVTLVLPALALLALTGFLVPLALGGLAALLVACGAGLALFREGPLWPRRPSRIAYAAYLILPPALEVGLLVTAAGGLGAALRAIGRSATDAPAGTPPTGARPAPAPPRSSPPRRGSLQS